MLSCVACACGSDGPAPGDSAGSGGLPTSTGGAGDPGSGGAVSSGGAPTGGIGGSVGDGGSFAGGAGGALGGGTDAGGTSGGSDAGGTSGGTGGGESLVLTSPAFENVVGCSVENSSVCDVFPDENVSYMGGANISPELHWSGVPAGTQSFALVLFDVTFGQAHWALWNIPGDITQLEADVAQDTPTPPSPSGSQQANANFATTSEDGYFGPHIPCNVFEFQLYALSTAAFAPQDPESAVLVSIELAELGEPVLGVARLTGRSDDAMTACD